MSWTQKSPAFIGDGQVFFEPDISDAAEFDAEFDREDVVFFEGYRRRFAVTLPFRSDDGRAVVNRTTDLMSQRMFIHRIAAFLQTLTRDGVDLVADRARTVQLSDFGYYISNGIEGIDQFGRSAAFS